MRAHRLLFLFLFSLALARSNARADAPALAPPPGSLPLHVSGGWVCKVKMYGAGGGPGGFQRWGAMEVTLSENAAGSGTNDADCSRAKGPFKIVAWEKHPYGERERLLRQYGKDAAAFSEAEMVEVYRSLLQAAELGWRVHIEHNAAKNIFSVGIHAAKVRWK